MNAFIKTSVIILGSIALVGCSIHKSHHHGHYGYRGHHHSSVHVSSRISGKNVAGALVAGAVIGYVFNEATRHHRDHHYTPAKSSNYDDHQQTYQEPDSNYYLLTKEGDCFWVQKDHKNMLRKTEVDAKYCSDDQDDYDN